MVVAVVLAVLSQLWLCLGCGLVLCGLGQGFLQFSFVLYCLSVDYMWLGAVLSWLSLPTVVL